MRANKLFTSRKNADAYDAIIAVFTALYKELKDLGKKKPEALLSKSKVDLINRVLVDAKACLEGQAEAKYLDLLDDDALPQYGDAILAMSQYEGALSAFRSRYYGFDGTEYNWFVE
ncbi:hypothetical protein [Methyloferula stellata]|uniref:hypothetical protein n=1 Tax=Methyloferula stellata TaxID=876270 RepID=UPI001AEBDB7A|nr:hypothetical protein [Methyloferula stellata]